jgi:hypothetical protein
MIADRRKRRATLVRGESMTGDEDPDRGMGVPPLLRTATFPRACVHAREIAAWTTVGMPEHAAREDRSGGVMGG